MSTRQEPTKTVDGEREYRGALASVFDNTTTVRLIEYLAISGSARQVDIADAIDVTEPAVTRAKQDLLEHGVLEVTQNTDGSITLGLPGTLRLQIVETIRVLRELETQTTDTDGIEPTDE